MAFPTAEVPLTAFHRNELIDSKLLPIKYVAYSLVLGERQEVMEEIRRVNKTTSI